MSQDPEVIRQEIDETRNSLTDKIGLLEQQVVETVQEATSGVKETVEAVKDAVQETVQTVKETVGETVDTVKETFSIRCQVERRPWLMMAGSAGVGFLAGYLATPPAPPTGLPPPPSRTGNGFHGEHFAKAASFTDHAEAPTDGAATGFLGQLARAFEGEISQLKSLAIGTLAAVVRDLVVPKVPEAIGSSIKEVIGDFTSKLGGKVIRERILPEDWTAQPSDNDKRTAPEAACGQR